MNWRLIVRPRTAVLFLLWSLPILFYVGAGIVALYQTGWFYWIIWTLPPIWLAAWLIGRIWKPAKLHQSAKLQPLTAPTFWTDQDADAIKVVEEFRSQVDDVDYQVIVDADRYLADAKTLAALLAKHYHSGQHDNFLHPLTLVEILTVIHLAVEDLEQWVIDNVPGSDLATVGQLQRIPGYINAFDVAQKVVFIASAVFNPAKLAAYPLWRKSGQVTFELQNELIRTFYQRYLRQLGYYLIEMYSGRLQAGSRNYREKFGTLSAAVNASGGDTTWLNRLDDAVVTIAVMGQVKAGKSSLINALMGDRVATTSILPETRQVARYAFAIDASRSSVILLDTPGYAEADVTRQQQREIQAACEAADIVLLVMAANVSARQADLQAIASIEQHYRAHRQLRKPTIIAVLSHIDLLRPIRSWEPPYDWENPRSTKEHSIAAAVAYIKELCGESIADFACVYTGEHPDRETNVAEALVPQLVNHLDQGRSAAVLKAFYKQLSRDRFKRLAAQVIGLTKQIR